MVQEYDYQIHERHFFSSEFSLRYDLDTYAIDINLRPNIY